MSGVVHKYITIRHTYTREESAEYRRIVLARQQLDKDEAALVSLVKRDPDAILAAKLASYAHKPEVTLTYNDATLKFTVTEKVVEEEKPKAPQAPPPPPPPVYMDPKTLNTLLHGKMLTDEQKLTLVERTHLGLILRADSAPEATQ